MFGLMLAAGNEYLSVRQRAQTQELAKKARLTCILGSLMGIFLTLSIAALVFALFETVRMYQGPVLAAVITAGACALLALLLGLYLRMALRKKSTH